MWSALAVLSNRTHLTMILTLLVLTLCAAICGRSAADSAAPSSSSQQCKASIAGNAVKAQSMLQVSQRSTPSAQGSEVGFLNWETAKVQDEPAALGEMRAAPPCTVSNLTQACLPSFMVIGTQKAGTSSLFNIIRTHPRISPAFKKELLWFNGNFERTRCDPPDAHPNDWEFAMYLDKFPKLPSNTTMLTGEFSATYMHCWCCPRAMKRLMPDLRLITQLRDPIERARSRWTEQHTWAKKMTTYDSFEDYIDMELPKLEACLMTAEGNLQEETHCAAKSNILGLSLYDSVIELWLTHFHPSNFLVTYLEQLAVSPQSVASAIHRHLGIEDLQYQDDLLHKKYNAKGNYGWKKAEGMEALQMSNTTAMTKLYQFYRPHMQQLKVLADAKYISPLPASWIARWKL